MDGARPFVNIAAVLLFSAELRYLSPSLSIGTLPGAPLSPFTGTDLICFRGGRTVFAGLDFAVGPGDALILRGPNGSGKSSLLRLMAGLGRPLQGTIAWDGAPVFEDPEAHNARLHYIGHADPVKPVLTVSENLRFWASLRAGPGDGGDPISSALGRLGIGHLADVRRQDAALGPRRVVLGQFGDAVEQVRAVRIVKELAVHPLRVLQ